MKSIDDASLYSPFRPLLPPQRPPESLAASPSPSPTMASPPPSPSTASPPPSLTTVPCIRSQNPRKKALNPSFSDLPSCLVEVIMSRLVVKDNIRASGACRSWRKAALYVRVVEKHPWLLCLPKRGSLIKLHDPLYSKSYTLDLPELAKSTVCSTRDGWLLMRRLVSNEIFFFNPFTKKHISLPKLDLTLLEIGFSCAPTSKNCLLVALSFSQGGPVIGSTCRPGATEWVSEGFPVGGFGQFWDSHSKLVYVGDRFYCFNATEGCLYSFHPASRKWYCHDARSMYYQQRWKLVDKLVSLAEKKGELFLMFSCGNEKPLVYKLATYFQWEEMSGSDALDGLTIFVSLCNVELRSDLPWMRNSVYFSRFGNNRKRCVTYSFDENRCNTRKEWHSWIELCPPQCLWIDPPENVLAYL